MHTHNLTLLQAAGTALHVTPESVLAQWAAQRCAAVGVAFGAALGRISGFDASPLNTTYGAARRGVSWRGDESMLAPSAAMSRLTAPAAASVTSPTATAAALADARVMCALVFAVTAANRGRAGPKAFAEAYPRAPGARACVAKALRSAHELAGVPPLLDAVHFAENPLNAVVSPRALVLYTALLYKEWQQTRGAAVAGSVLLGVNGDASALNASMFSLGGGGGIPVSHSLDTTDLSDVGSATPNEGEIFALLDDVSRARREVDQQVADMEQQLQNAARAAGQQQAQAGVQVASLKREIEAIKAAKGGAAPVAAAPGGAVLWLRVALMCVVMLAAGVWVGVSLGPAATQNRQFLVAEVQRQLMGVSDISAWRSAEAAMGEEIAAQFRAEAALSERFKRSQGELGSLLSNLGARVSAQEAHIGALRRELERMQDAAPAELGDSAHLVALETEVHAIHTASRVQFWALGVPAVVALGGVALWLSRVDKRMETGAIISPRGAPPARLPVKLVEREIPAVGEAEPASPAKKAAPKKRVTRRARK